MTYAVKLSDPDFGASLRRVADAQIAGAIAALSQPDPRVDGIHRARKSIKKTRAFLRLFRPVWSGSGPEIRALRNSARLVAGHRDLTVQLETLNRLTETVLDSYVTALLRRHLLLTRTWAETSSLPGQIGDMRHSLAVIRNRIPQWTPTRCDWADISAGLARTMDRAETTRLRARQDKDPEALHEWRKHVKDHWYHLRLLRPVRPDKLTPRLRNFDSLGKLLGAHDDICGLRTAALAAPLGPSQQAGFHKALDRAAAKLRKQALRMGDQLAGDDPDKLIRQWGKWERRWRRP